MQKLKQKIRLIYWGIAIPLTVVFFILLPRLHLEKPWSVIVPIAWILLVILGAFGKSMLWYSSLSRQFNALTPLLWKDPDLYIEKLNALLADFPDPGWQMIRNVNLAAAYCEKGLYLNAQEYLNKVDPQKLASSQRGPYWANLALIHFHSGRKRKAMDILREQASYLEPMRGGRRGATMAVLDIFALLAEGKKDEARVKLAEAQEFWQDPSSQRELARVAQKCK